MDKYEVKSDKDNFKILLNSVKHSKESLDKVRIGKIDKNLLTYINLMHSATYDSFEKIMKKLLLLEEKINNIQININKLESKDENVQISCWHL